ncbi:hypothetical protein Zmor_006938 [Zophobas morio]|uniref:Uncharacterized protein n=1 Tax=Zophobas morio TaxID=2755281 RepID=A0AA38IT32_9CUCU|nr:hypothetical protein Zmor_006938 [Zophobas morio]
MDSEPRTRIRAISAKTLSSYGYAVCLFPEQPTREVIVEQDRAVEEHVQKAAVKEVEATTKPKFEVRNIWFIFLLTELLVQILVDKTLLEE